MSDILLPMDLRHARSSIRYVDSTGVSRSVFTGAAVTAAKGGDRLSYSLQFTPHGGSASTGPSERARLRSFLARLRGRQNRAYLYDASYQRRGNFPTGELLTNNTFANGTTGWNAASAALTISAQDRFLRVRRNQSYSSADLVVPVSPATVLPYMPYAARVMEKIGAGTWNLLGVQAGTTSGGQDYGFTFGVVGGLKTLAFVPSGSSAYFGLVDFQTDTMLAGDYYETPYISLSRCALVDVGANALLYSDQFDQSAWTKANVTVTANGGTAPDGTITADALVETAATGTHSLSQAASTTSAAQDLAFACSVQGATRGFCAIEIATVGGSVSVYFNLSTGAISTAAAAAGNFSNPRAYISSLGNGAYYCCVVGRKTGSETTATATIYAANVTGSVSYTGSAGSTALYLWRATLRVSSLPTKLYQSTSPAPAAEVPSGSALTLKGLPASTNGLLEIDDQVEIVTSRGSELKLVTARLNSDAAGLGYLQFEPPIRTSPADNAAVIINQPMGRFVFAGDTVGFDSDPGFWTTASAEFEESV